MWMTRYITVFRTFLVRMMNNIQFLSSGNAAAMVGSGMASLPSTGIRMALAVVGVLPIVVIYPFLQKYLTKGVIMGRSQRLKETKS